MALTAAAVPDEQKQRAVMGQRTRTVKKRQKMISKAKACAILHDGTVRGNAITDRQRRFMGARCNA